MSAINISTNNFQKEVMNSDKPVLLDFWASWCGPCRMENPNMVKLYDDFKDKGLAVISVSLDERKAAWTQAIQKDGMPGYTCPT